MNDEYSKKQAPGGHMHSIKKSFWKGVDKIREAWEENPLMVIGVVGASAAGIAKLMDTVASVQSKRAYARQVRQSVKERERERS